MAGSKANAKMKNQKRKQRFDAEPQTSSKRHRLDIAPERHSPWNNLQLILCIQDKDHDLSRLLSVL